MQFETKLERVEVCEHIFVDEFKFAVRKFKVDLLIDLFDLVERGVGASVRAHDTVKGKRAVVGLVSPVSAVGVLYRAVRHHALDRLVGKVPNITAAESVVFSEMHPVVVEIAETVAHAMRIFALNIRQIFVHLWCEPMSKRSPNRCESVNIQPVFAEFFHILLFGVHFAHDVSDSHVRVRFVVYWASRIKFSRNFLHLGKRLAVSALVAERPKEYAGVISIGSHHILHTPANLLYPTLVGMRYAAREPVRFQVVFAHNHNSVLVAKFVEEARIRIMARSYAVDVVSLEEKNILFGVFLWNGVSEIGMEFVAVDASDFEFFAVQQNRRFFPVYGRNGLYLSEAEVEFPSVVENVLLRFCVF